jgi:serine/threonine-protein kinase
VATANPEKIGRYQVIERVGRGGMGVLFRGVDPVLDREVAIKLMLVDFTNDAEDMRPRFYREARAAAKLQHPNIVTVFEFAEENGTPYIVMEFLRGVSLAARMASPPPLTLDDKLNIIAQLSSALSYAHEQGVVHRDVKPANVFILPDGSVKLLDFGVAKLTTSNLTRQGDVLGSASYMSPEQVAGAESVDGRSDVFSAGVVLYELLAGKKPFQAETPTAIVVKILYEEPPPLDDPSVPAPVLAAVKKALAKNPAERFQTAAEFARELQSIRRTLQAADSTAAAFEETRFASQAELKNMQKELAAARQAAVASTTETAPPEPTRPGWIVPAVAAAAVLAIAAGAMLLRGGGTDGPNAAAPASASAPAGATPEGAGASATPAAASAAAPAASAVALKISSDPAGAAILVNGQETRQVTPATIDLQGSGPHQIRLTRRGFVDYEGTLAAADLERGAVSYTLKPAEAARVAVSITSAYPVEVYEGSRIVSPEADTHKLTVAAGSSLRIAAPKFVLSAPLRVEGKPIDFQTPPLGYLTVRTNHETCSVMIGKQTLGYPPITRMPIVAGQHRIDMVCPDGQNPPGQFVTIGPNGEAVVRIY